MFTRSQLTISPAIIFGRYYTRNIYPQLLKNFIHNDFWVGIIPAMYTRSHLTTLPAMVLGRYYTCNLYLQSLNNFYWQ